MELEVFIETTMQSMIDATSTLLDKNERKGVSINPFIRHASGENYVWYSDGAMPVTEVSFDVAVTEGTAKSGEANGSIDVYFAKTGGKGTTSASNENVSRVQFTLRVALPGTDASDNGRPYNQRF